MKVLDIQAAVGAAVLVLSLPCEAKHGHGHGISHLEILQKKHSHQRIHASPRVDSPVDELRKRAANCAFPTDVGLVAVTPGSQNAGWAMSPDQTCSPGTYCPYACPPSQLMAQWNPAATSYTYPLSMDGGLYCDSNGVLSKPFPNSPHCVAGTGSVTAQNTCGPTVSFCQTVLPGNEAMLIPTAVDGTAELAVPGTSYWASTAAHYYINPPGIGVVDACVWGDGSKPLGNWSPYVAGANADSTGQTFVKIGWNPIWTASSLASTPPTFGVKIVCAGSGCNGTPCSIDPSVNGVGGVTSADQATGAGGANFCVVTVPAGETANIVVFNVGNSNAVVGTSSSKTTSSASSSHTPSSTPPSGTTSTSSTAAVSTTATFSSLLFAPTRGANSTSLPPTAENSPHVLFENPSSTAAAVTSETSLSTTTTTSPIPTQKKNAAPRPLLSSSASSLVVAFAALAGFLI